MASMLAPPPQNARVAVIGGGVAGLMCATKLRQLGVQTVVVYDTGKNAVGGRMSSRDIVVPGPGGQKHNLRVDHSAQLLCATTPRFQRMLDHWATKGLVAPYPQGAVGTLQAADGSFSPRAEGLPPTYYAPQGMRSLAAHLSEGLEVRRPVWVGRVQRRDPEPGAPVVWDVFGERNKHLGAYDYLVVAHNGKCADRLMSTADSPAIHALLRTKFTPSATPQQVMQMCSLWVAIAVFPSSLGLPYQAAFIEGDPDLSYISNNSSRVAVNSRAEPMEAWTLISTRRFGAENKVPQEAIPPVKEREVKAFLLDALSRVTRLPRTDLQPVYERLQLWGAAVPLNVTNAPCVLDAATQCGIAGDWLVAPSVEGAALSGVALAERIVAHASGQVSGSSGLDLKYRATQGPALGAVPTGSSGAGVEAGVAAAGGGGAQGPAGTNMGDEYDSTPETSLDTSVESVEDPAAEYAEESATDAPPPDDDTSAQEEATVHCSSTTGSGLTQLPPSAVGSSPAVNSTAGEPQEDGLWVDTSKEQATFGARIGPPPDEVPPEDQGLAPVRDPGAPEHGWIRLGDGPGKSQ